MNTINFTRAKTELLREAYRKAKAEKQEQFTFEGHPLLVAYAKYLLEYLDMNFRPETGSVPESCYLCRKDNGK